MRVDVQLSKQEIVTPGQTSAGKLFGSEDKHGSPGGWRAAILRLWGLFICLAALLSPAALHAQTFQAIPALSFTMPYGGAAPLPQIISIGSTGAQLRYSVSATTTTGGSWLTLPAANGCCYYTPEAVMVAATPAANLSVGTYSGTIVVTSGTITMTIPVSLIIEPSTATFFDAPAGALTFSVTTAGKAPPTQPLGIRNAGTGTLAWTATTSTADGGGWLTLSASSGTAPSVLNVGINPAKLPSASLVAGTFTGMVVLHTGADTVTVPITMAVGPSVLRQINPITFTKTYANPGNPSAQIISLSAADASNVRIITTAINATGGSWLATTSRGCCYSTPQSLTVTADPAVMLAAGTYTSEIVLSATDGSDMIVVPVTLIVEPTTATYFDNSVGALTFSMQTDGLAPPVQSVPIRNASAGTLSWTAAASTADGGSWLTLSATSGTAPATLNVGINPANLPGTGLLAGTYVGNVVLTTAGDTVTVPVSLTIGTSVLRQINPLTFTQTFAGANAPDQVINLAATDDSAIRITATTISATGGNWLSISINGCCSYTPQSIEVSVNPGVTLAAGTYTASIVLQALNGGQAVIVPVTLVIKPSTATYFDEMPGQLTYSMTTSGNAPPAQLVQIRNAGTGTLSWTATTSTSDGGKWLTLSATSGNAPYLLNVGVTPSALPGGDLVAGTYTGQVVLQTAGDSVTIPVSFIVGTSVLRQINPLSFSMVYAGAPPLPQVISLATSDNSAVRFTAAVSSSTGGNWLSISLSGCCYDAPQDITVSVNPIVTLAPGAYTAEIELTASDGSQGIVVPVTLNIEPAAATFFDTLPGGLTFSMLPSTTAPAAQSLPIHNAGPGTLNWAAIVTTADGGKWLNLSTSSGTAPVTPTVSINPANLPGNGLVYGNYVGQIMLETIGDIVTVPVTVTIGPTVFHQLAPLSFSMNYHGTNPLTQAFTLTDTGGGLRYVVGADNSTGGNWFAINGNGCCYGTPTTFTATATPSVNIGPGVYTSEVVGTITQGSEATVIPVTLTVNSSTATAAPSFSPAGGAYDADQSVILTSATNDAAIYYTTNGTTPSTSSTRYTSPIPVTATQTIKAIAIAPAYAQSSVSSATYTITAPVAATPSASEVLTITEATAGATVYYTTNGATPTSASAKYTGPISLSSNPGTWVYQFIAIGPNYTSSAVRTVTVTVK